MQDTGEFKYAGTVSHGTLQPVDLAKAFYPIAHEFDPEAVEAYLRDEDHKALWRWWTSLMPDVPESEKARMERWYDEGGQVDVSDFVAYLEDKLNYFAPEGYYFGAIEGDGSDFGFWLMPDEEPDEPEPVSGGFWGTVFPPEGVVLVVNVCRMLDGLIEHMEANDELSPYGPEYEAHGRLVAALSVLQDGKPAVEEVLAEWVEDLAAKLGPVVKKAAASLTYIEEQVSAARTWLIDCFPDQEDEIKDASPEVIVAQTEKHYDGGWAAFLRDGNPVPA